MTGQLDSTSRQLPRLDEPRVEEWGRQVAWVRESPHEAGEKAADTRHAGHRHHLPECSVAYFARADCFTVRLKKPSAGRLRLIAAGLAQSRPVTRKQPHHHRQSTTGRATAGIADRHW